MSGNKTNKYPYLFKIYEVLTINICKAKIANATNYSKPYFKIKI